MLNADQNLYSLQFVAMIDQLIVGLQDFEVWEVLIHLHYLIIELRK